MARRYTIVLEGDGPVDHASTLAAASRKADTRARLNAGRTFLVQDEGGHNLYEAHVESAGGAR